MNTENEEKFAPVYMKYGNRWDPELMVNAADQYCPASFAIDLRTYIEKVFSSKALADRCKSLSVIFRYIENNSVNAVACKMHIDKEEYLVGIFSGAILKLKQIYFDDRFVESLRPVLKHLNSLPNEDLSRYALYFGSLFLSFHELGHIYRGHLNYLKPSQNQPMSLWDEAAELAASDNSTSGDGVLSRRHLSECDADAFSGALIAGEIAIHSKNIRKISSFETIKLPEISRELLILAGSAIHLVFCLFDQKPTPEDGNYPCPPIRSAILHGHLLAQLESERFDPIEITAAQIIALGKAEDFARQLNLRKSSIKLDLAFTTWKQKYLQALESMTTELIPFAPCNR